MILFNYILVKLARRFVKF